VNEARSPLYDYFQQGERKVSASRFGRHMSIKKFYTHPMRLDV